jgi:hypothetical protein
MTIFLTAAFIISILLSLIAVADELRDRRMGRRLHREIRRTFNPRLLGARRRAF